MSQEPTSFDRVTDTVRRARFRVAEELGELTVNVSDKLAITIDGLGRASVRATADLAAMTQRQLEHLIGQAVSQSLDALDTAALPAALQHSADGAERALAQMAVRMRTAMESFEEGVARGPGDRP